MIERNGKWQQIKIPVTFPNMAFENSASFIVNTYYINGIDSLQAI